MQYYRPSEKAQHRRVCDEEMVRCSICKDLMKRRVLHDEHNKDPDVVVRHNQALMGEVEHQQTTIRRLAIQLIPRLGESCELSWVIRSTMGNDVWRRVVGEGQLEPPRGVMLVNLIKVLVERLKNGEDQDSAVLVAAFKALWGAIDSAAAPRGVYEATVQALTACPIDAEVHLVALAVISVMGGSAVMAANVPRHSTP